MAATLARAACARSVGHRSRGGSALGGLRLLRCTRRVSCAVFLYAATRPWPLRLDGPPAVKTQLLAARGGDARARCLRPLGWPPQSRRLDTRRLAPPALYAARLLRCVSLRRRSLTSQQQKVANETVVGAIGPSKEVSQAARRRSSVCMPRATRETPFGTVVPSCWGARPGGLSATRSKVKTPARRMQIARRRCGPTDRPPSRRSCLPLVAATLARAACARSVGHRSRGGSALGGLRLLRCTRRVSCAVFLYAVTRPWPLRLDGPPAVKTQLLAARGGDARARCLRPLGWPPQSRRLDTRRLAPPALYAALLRCVSLRSTRPWPLRLDGPPAVKTQLLAARGGDARARCLRPLGWPPQSRRLGTRRLAPPALYAARLLRCVSLRSHTPVAAAARRTARRQDAAACRSWRRRSRALLAPARLATAVAAARHSAACASCAVRGASLALCFSTQPHARGRCGSTDRPPSRRSCLPLVAATLARAACARSVGHRSRGGSTLGGLRLLRCKRHTPEAAAARRTARRQDAAACRSWRRRSRALLAPARLATAVAAARHSAACASCAARGASLALCFSTQPHARGRCGSTDRPPSRRSCLPLVAATLARAACARSVGHRSRGGSTLGGLRLLRCTAARLLRCVSLRRRSLTSQQQKVANETVVGAIGPLQGGEPGGPASVVGMYAPGDTGNPASGRWYLRAGVPDRADCRQPAA